MDAGGIGWGLQTIIGAAILAGVLLWVMLRNKATKEDIDRTEDATRELYREEEAARDHDDDKGP
jgi:hypothetical protein